MEMEVQEGGGVDLSHFGSDSFQRGPLTLKNPPETNK